MPKKNIYTLDEANKKGLLALNKSFKEPLNEEESSDATKFLESVIGNIELNAFLRQHEAEKLGISKELKVMLEYISYKTRNIDIEKAEEIIEKMTRAQDSTRRRELIKGEDRVTLKEFAIISDLAKVAYYTLNGSEKLKKLDATAKNAKKIVDILNEDVNKNLAQVGPGTIIFDDSARRKALDRKTLTFSDKVFIFFSKSDHTSVLHTDKIGTAVRSEITLAKHNPAHNKIGIAHHLIADTYQIDVSTLIPKTAHKTMIDTYGKDWKKEISTKYKVIEDNIHGAEALKRFGNLYPEGQDAQIKAGKANLIPFGHKQVKANDFEEIHHKVMSNHYAHQKDPKMLCSEFSGVTVIAALVELEKQIKQDIGKKAPKTIVKIPIGKYEDLHKMHPGRLLDILKEKGCVTKAKVTTDEYFKEADTIGQKLRKHIAKNISLTPSHHKPKSAGRSEIVNNI